VGFRAGLEAVVKRTIPSLSLSGIDPGRPARSLSTTLTELPRLLSAKDGVRPIYL
jgi:hypothetical protein